MRCHVSSLKRSCPTLVLYSAVVTRWTRPTSRSSSSKGMSPSFLLSRSQNQSEAVMRSLPTITMPVRQSRGGRKNTGHKSYNRRENHDAHVNKTVGG